MKPGTFANCLTRVFDFRRALTARYHKLAWRGLVLAGLCAFSSAESYASGTAYDLPSLMSALAGGGSVTFVSNCTVVLSQTITIAQNTVLNGNGYAVTISGSNAVGVFYVNTNVQFTLENVTVANGSIVGTNTTNAASGAGLYNAGGTVALVNCVFSGNTVLGYSGDQEIGGPASGGAAFNQAGSLNVTNCIFSSNSAIGGTFVFPYGHGYGGTADGGAICNSGGTVSLASSSFLANIAVGGKETDEEDQQGTTVEGHAFGGAFATTNGTVIVYNCIFSGNTAIAPLVNAINRSTGGQAAGGAIYQSSGALTMIGTALTNNMAIGGSLEWYNGTPGNGQGGALFIQGTLNSTNCTFTGNTATGGGYGALAGNGMGGAIFNSGLATLANATIAGNTAIGGQGGQDSEGEGSTLSGSAEGGGILNSNTLILLASTVSGNSALGGPGFISVALPGDGGDAFGGGIYNLGSYSATNDTIVDNSANGGATATAHNNYGVPMGGNGNGGGIFNASSTVMLAFQTISSNSANGGAGTSAGIGTGGGIYASNGTVTLQDSIVAYSGSGSNFYVLSNALTDAGYNISSDTSFTLTGTGSLNNTDPMLGSLAFYGGPTMTVALLSNSPAIDAAGSVFPPTDQRGLPRPYGPAADIGAYEFMPSFTIQGQITGFPPRSFSLAAGIFYNVTDASGNYILQGVISGAYTVTPSAPGFLFVPPSQNVNVGPSVSNINFTAYRINALALEGITNGALHLAFAGAIGQTEVLQSSSNLLNWSSVSTNTVGTNGIFDVYVPVNPAQPSLFLQTRTP